MKILVVLNRPDGLTHWRSSTHYSVEFRVQEGCLSIFDSRDGNLLITYPLTSIQYWKVEK